MQDKQIIIIVVVVILHNYTEPSSMGANVAPGLNDTELQKKVTLMQRSALSFGAFHRKKGHKETQSQTVPPVCIVTVIMYVRVVVVVVVVVVKSPRALAAQVPVSVPTSFLSTDHLLTTYRPLTNHLPTTYRPPTDHLPTTYRPLTNHLPTTY